MMMRRTLWIAPVAVGCVVAALSVPCAAQEAAPVSEAPRVQTRDQAKFGGLAVLPSCLTFAVDRGDPMTGSSTLLLKMTSGCVVPWHWHTVREELMLVSGRGKIEFHNLPAHALGQGGYALLPAKDPHQFTCETDCLLFDAIAGKFDIHYIDRTGKEIAVGPALSAVSERPPATN
jgi:quercetin dioxygenase-like cupin family protein